MNNRIKLAGVVLSGLFFVGCDKKDDSASSAPPAATAPAAPSVSDKVNNTVAPIAGAMQDAKTNASTAISSATDSAKTMAGTAADNAKTATDTAQTTAATASDTAKTKLAQVGTYLLDKKYDAADVVLKQVEGMKSSLSPTLQQEVTDLRTKLDLAKTAQNSGISIPSFGGK